MIISVDFVAISYIIIQDMNEFTAKTYIEEILAKYPSLSKVFIEFKMPCLICGEPFWGTVEQLANQYHINPDKLVKKLNEQKEEIGEKT